ncbi:MAG TPA: histone deacetylase family protein, partial [Phenylobacterium sp.]
MVLALYTHQDMLDHRPGEHHPESPERLAAVIGALEDASDLDLSPNDAPLAEIADLELVHDPAYVKAILAAAPAHGLRHLDADTSMSPGSVPA